MSLSGLRPRSSASARWAPVGSTCDNALSQGLLRVVDLGLFAILFVAPLFLGGRHPVGHLVYAVLCASTAVAWLAHQWFASDRYWIRTSAELLILAVVLLVVLQLVPLPESLRSVIVGQRSAMLPLWQSHRQSRTYRN